MDSSHLVPSIHGSFGSHKPAMQAVSRSVQPLLQGLWTWPTDRQTDHPTPCVVIGHYVCSLIITMLRRLCIRKLQTSGQNISRTVITPTLSAVPRDTRHVPRHINHPTPTKPTTIATATCPRHPYHHQPSWNRSCRHTSLHCRAVATSRSFSVWTASRREHTVSSTEQSTARLVCQSVCQSVRI